VHVAAWIEASTRELAAPSVKRRLAALRHLFDWLVNGQVVPKLGNHSFRATGITAYLKNGGTLEKAAAMANHASTRTPQLYRQRSLNTVTIVG
jgi:site-specific recombinase XerC